MQLMCTACTQTAWRCPRPRPTPTASDRVSRPLIGGETDTKLKLCTWTPLRGLTCDLASHRADAFLTIAKTTSLSVSERKPGHVPLGRAHSFCRGYKSTKSLMPHGVQKTAGVGVRGPRPRAMSSLSGPIDLGPHNNVASRSKSTDTVAGARLL